jgi:hypothetical protein
MPTEVAMSALRLITDRELAAFEALLERHGWRRQDFDLQEDVFDPRAAELEAALGEVAVHCRETEAVEVYRLGAGFDWIAELADDLQRGKFGRGETG